MKSLIKFLVIFILLGCTREDNRGSVFLLHYFTGNLSSGVDNLSNVLDSKKKNIDLIATPLDHEEFKVSIRLQLESENPPDLFTYWAGARTEYLVNRGQLSPITEIFNSDINRSIFGQSVIDACSHNGEIYLLPITRHYVGFFYNKKVFSQSGVKEPETWTELIDSGEKIKDGGIYPFALGGKNRWPAQFWFDYLILRTMGYDYRTDLMDGKIPYNDQGVINAVSLWKELIDKGFFDEGVIGEDWDRAALKVISGESAMTLMGTWLIPLFKENGLKSGEDYGFFPFPRINNLGESVSLGPIDGILMSKLAKNRESSRDILIELSKPETQEAFNSLSGAIAPNINVEDKIYNVIQLEIKELINKSSHWAFNYDLATEPAVSEIGLNFFIKFINNPEEYVELLNNLNKEVLELSADTTG